jgi:plastocyanin
MITTTDDERATAPPPRETVASPAGVAALRSQRWGAGPTFDQFILSLLPLTLAVALAFGIITYAAIRTLPASDTGARVAAPAAGEAPITAFSDAPAAQQIPVAADPTGALKWDRTTYEARAGDVTFVVTNKSSSTHNFAVEGGNVKAQGKNFGTNTTTMYTVKGLKPGTYQIVCNFPGHKEGGMVAVLIVK